MKDFNYIKLKNLRKSRGYTQAKMADLIGIARTTYADYEKGRILPPIDKIKRICELFSLQLSDLTTLSEGSQLQLKQNNLEKIMQDVQQLDIPLIEKDAILSVMRLVIARQVLNND